MPNSEPGSRCDPDGGTLLPWYVVQTNPGKEIAVWKRLLDFQCYVPMEATRRIVLKNGRPVFENGVRKTEEVKKPFFLRYLFVSFDVDANDWTEIFYTEDVSRLFCQYRGDRPIPLRLPMGYVEGLQRRGRAGDGLIDLEAERRGHLPDPNWLAGSVATIMEGALTGHEAIIQANDVDRVTMLLSLFGRQTQVEMPLSAVDVR